MRPQLSPEKISSTAQQMMATFYTDIVKSAEEAIKANEWVIIGMSGNPFVKKARGYLTGKGKPFKYIEHGGYLTDWKPRLAIKLWSGWPTFPQIFHKGTLIGGYRDLEKYLP